MYSEFHTKASALDDSFLKGLRTIFKNKPISIIVEEDMDETEYLLASPANRKMLESSLKSEEGYEFTIDEFRKYSRDLMRGKNPDVSKLRKVKIPK
ncbi:MAG: hypothetical protein A3H98_08345 [Bacteroidetes bacterium RIFCSPLOWO2_02_FULL_36_8]|nr:MAG: hypothetical protein A3H98_08345 [Bacteroidetes bacterium RIFCSPLOWO2_02_FULL_36_8]OFY68856.1 MAG: hypothetical protein A3G23_03460 [Bacteroidetes bacterium RIFCSPLOWO2_12_FULL_37_12]